MPIESNWEVDELAQVALGVKMSEELTHKLIVIGKNNHLSIYERGIRLEVFSTYANVAGVWRIKIIKYLEDPNRQVPHRVKAQSQNFALLEGELYRKGPNGLLLRCLSFPYNMEVMKQVTNVNHTSIYSVLCMYLFNLNARFTPIFLKITLIPYLLMFCKIKRKIKQGNGKKLRRKNLHFATTRRFTKVKKPSPRQRGPPRQRSLRRDEEVRQGEDILRLGKGGIIRRQSSTWPR